MKFSAEKKKAIVQYILEKVAEGGEGLSRRVAETFGISQNTVHLYLSSLLEEGILTKGKRGEYTLTQNSFTHTLSRSAGELASDTYVYEKLLLPHIGDLPDNAKHIWNYAVSEMVNNVIDHSGAEHLYVFIGQDRLFTRMAITDDGIGIFRKIKEHFALADLDEAIGELFKGKLTTDAANHSGEGIFFTSRIMDTFLISSDGKVFTTTKFEEDEISELDRPTEGTCVYMALSNTTQKEIRDVFDMYSDSEGAFSKTSLVMKNFFDSAPVSRSQAKRVCMRLEQFEEVTFDFTGIEWMGQGFAHQLFVVFQNAHPQIKLIPINMCADVQKMYDHAKRTV